MLENETIRIIKQRRSIRNYQEKQISDDELYTILEAGVYAPNGSGDIENFIHFTVIQNKDMLEKINALAKEIAVRSDFPDLAELGNNKDFNCFYGAPTYIIVSYNNDWVQPETDTAAATQNMLLAAESLGLGSCWLYFPLQAFLSPSGNELLRELGIPDDFKPFQSIILGYKTHTPLRQVKNISFIH